MGEPFTREQSHEAIPPMKQMRVCSTTSKTHNTTPVHEDIIAICGPICFLCPRTDVNHWHAKGINSTALLNTQCRGIGARMPFGIPGRGTPHANLDSARQKK